MKLPAKLKTLFGSVEASADASAPAVPVPTAAPEPFPDPDTQGWPTDESPDAAKVLLQGKVDTRLKRIDAEIARTAARHDADMMDLGRFATNYETLATGSVDRARAGADAVQKSAAAIAVLYTGVLGLSFSVTDNPLPPRGVLPAVFLGTAVVLSTAYLAFLRPSEESVAAPFATASGTVETNVLARVGVLVEASRTVTARLSWCLRAAVLALGVGLVFLPLPFLTFGSKAVTSTPREWPSAALAQGDNLELAKLRYAEQLKERADARQSNATSSGGNETAVVGGGIIVGAAVMTVGTILSRPRAKKAAAQ